MKPLDDERCRLLTEWLRKAEDDVRTAELVIASDADLPNPIAFHSQQAVEKYLKAYLTWHQVPFPKTHDIERLLVLVESVDKDLADSLADTTVLAMYGVEVRYPGDMAEASDRDAQMAIALMRKTREAIRAVLPVAPQ